MSNREAPLAAAFAALLLTVFGRLLADPALIPGNFGDIYAYHYPLRHLVASTLQAGRLPLWNPYLFAGTPLAANPQGVLFYPGSAIHYFFPLAWSFSADFFLHLLFAWLGAFLLLRKWGLDRAGAWLLAVSYAASPFLVCRVPQGIPTHLAGLSWIPWLWLLAQGSSTALWGLALALQILSGHPQFALLNLLALGLWAAIRRPSRLPALAAGAIFSLALACGQVWPTLQFLAHSVRTQWSAGYSLGYSLRPEYLATFAYPDAFGNPSEAGFRLFPSEYFEMLTGYIGLIPLCLGAAGLSRSRAPLALLACALFFALGQNNPAYVPIQKLLRLDFLRVPSRFMIDALLALWLAAAVGWKAFCSKRKAWLKAALVAAGTADVLLWSLTWIFPQTAANFLASNAPTLQKLRTPGYRFATSPEIASANKAMLYRLPNVTGYEAFYLAPIALYTSRSEGKAAADGSRTYVRNWRTPAMERLAVRYYLEGDGTVLENPRALELVQGSSTWSLSNAERYDVLADAPTDVRFAQARYPGWKLWVDGRRTEMTEESGLFPSVHLDGEGPRRLRFVYLPSLWFLSVAISILSLCALATYSAGGIQRWKY